MEKNELRVGNVVYDSLNQSYDIVIGINNNDTVDFPFELNNDINFIDGIKISGEILKKLGFEKVSNSEEYYIWEYNNGDVHKRISLYEFDKMWCINITYSEDIRYNAQGLHFRNIKYVHQIQNAYFTLTGGEELDINNLLK
jgi:hypothetical protein